MVLPLIRRYYGWISRLRFSEAKIGRRGSVSRIPVVPGAFFNRNDQISS